MKILETLNSPDTPSNTNLQVVEVTDAQVALINQQTLVPYQPEQLFVFQVLLIDDSVTRNYTQYPESFQRTILSKEPRKGNWVGLTFLMGEFGDHEAKARNQKARIFNAYLVQTPTGNVGTMAEAYIPVNSSTEALIDNIKAGIHREVSIGVAVEKPTCSIDGEDIRQCPHWPGENYDGVTAHVIMQGDGEAHEVSFVAVPGSYHAQILSDTSGYVPLSEGLNKTPIQKKEAKGVKKELKELLARLLEDLDDKEPDDEEPKEGMPNDPDEMPMDPDPDMMDDDDDPKQEESLRNASEKLAVLKEEAKFGRVYREDLVQETIRLGLLARAIPVQSQETFKKTFNKLGVEELKAFRDGYKAEVERLYPPSGQAVALTENKEESTQVKPVNLGDIVAQFNKKKGAR